MKKFIITVEFIQTHSLMGKVMKYVINAANKREAIYEAQNRFEKEYPYSSVRRCKCKEIKPPPEYKPAELCEPHKIQGRPTMRRKWRLMRGNRSS